VTAPVFRTLDGVEYGQPDQLTPLVRRVVAKNPSKFTYLGTGTYILGHRDVVVIDPGPILDSHREALERALDGERVRAILITHCHSDHSPLAAWLQDQTGAPTIAYGSHPRPDPMWKELMSDPWPPEPEPERDTDVDTDPDSQEPVEMEESIDYDFTPTIAPVDGGVVVDAGGLTITAVHTPGHTSNHMCFALAEEQSLFTGDHIMGWSTTVVSPPDGDMAAYIDSLQRVAARADAVLYPTHGPPRDDAREFVPALVEHRLERERGVIDALEAGRTTIPDIVGLLYADVRKELHKAAGMSVWAHLLKLVADGRVVVADGEPPALAAAYLPA
jgi:glyoxylase-like metal-dependent hydrolase (beta-lactamase superfamily II)